MQEIRNAKIPAGNYNKIGGGLILIAILLVYMLLSLLFVSGMSTALMFANKSTIVSLLEPMDIKIYYTVLKPFLIYELVKNTILITFLIIILVYFFRRKKPFIKLMIVFIALSLLLMVFDRYFANALFTMPQGGTMKDVLWYFSRMVVYALILTYLFISKRVKATFIN